MTSSFHCPFCLSEIEKTKNCCDYHFKLTEEGIFYEHEKILLDKFTKDFILNKTLNTNGHLAYYLLPEGSVSQPEREDVKSFASYIRKYHKSGNIVDVGCGPLEVPGYLLEIQGDSNKFFGVDPMPEIKFKGVKIIGCCEYLPLKSCSMDTLIFATTIDHVCNLSQTFKEAHRVLNSGGKVICWHGYNNTPYLNFKQKLKYWMNKKARFVHYPNGASFMVPKGGQDPFHKEYACPSKLIKIAEKNGFKCEDLSSSESDSFKIMQTHYYFSLEKR